MGRGSKGVVREQHEYAARDRVTDSLIGLLTLSTLYGTCFFFLGTAGASAMMGVWLLWVVAGIIASFSRPELMKWMTFGSVGSWTLLVLVLAFRG